MAAKYTKLLRSIWQDDDFTALTRGEQHLYFALISQPDISACGVLPLLERRWARLSADTDADSVRADLAALEQSPMPFVITDAATDEVWVRAYLKVDELYRVPNGRKAIDAALAAVASSLLRDHITHTYRTLAERVGVTLTGTVGPPQQQAAAASTKQLAPRSSSKHRDPTGNPSPNPSLRNGQRLPAAAAAAIDLLITHRLATEDNIRNATRYAARIRAAERTDHGQELDDAAEAGHDPEWIAQHVLGLTRSQVIAATVRQATP